MRTFNDNRLRVLTGLMAILLLGFSGKISLADPSDFPDASEWAKSRALKLQAHIDNDAPFPDTTWVGTHNSFSNNYDTSVFDPNHRRSLMDQLNDGVREIVFDLYYKYNAVRACHGGGCCWGVEGTQKFIDILRRIERWLHNNPGEVLIMKLELSSSVIKKINKLENKLENHLGKYIYRSDNRSYSGNNADDYEHCTDLRPDLVSKSQILSEDKQVIIYINHDGRCIRDSFSKNVFYGDETVKDVSTYNKLEDVSDDIRYNGMTRNKDGATLYSRFGPGAAKMWPENIAGFMDRGLNIFELYGWNGTPGSEWDTNGVSPVQPQNMVWSWDEDGYEPTDSADIQFAYIDSNSDRFRAIDRPSGVNMEYYAACRKLGNPNGSRARNKWRLTSVPVSFYDAEQQCIDDSASFDGDYWFAAPRNKQELNEVIRLRDSNAETRGQNIWINYKKSRGTWTADIGEADEEMRQECERRIEEDPSQVLGTICEPDNFNKFIDSVGEVDVLTWGGALDKIEQSLQKQAGGRYFTIYLPRTDLLSLAEVKLFQNGDNNNILRPYMVSQQSSSRISSSITGYPFRAIDGNTDGDYTHGSVTLTEEELYPWWQVDIGSEQSIDKVEIYNRTDCCQDRIFGVKTLFSSSPIVVKWRGRTKDQLTSISGNQSEGRFIRISPKNPSDSRQIKLKEVRVLGPDGTNHALGKFAWQSTTSSKGAHIAVNGQYNDHSRTQDVPYSWWIVDLGEVKQIKSIQITGVEDDTINQCKVEVDPEIDVSWINVDRESTVEGRTGRFVRVSLPTEGILSLADVEILAAAEIASGYTMLQYGANVKVTQSSIYPGGDPENAIDGRKNGDYGRDGVRFGAQTLFDQKPWWEIDLGEIKDISKIHVFSRTDSGYYDHVKNAIVEIDPPTVTWEGHNFYDRTTLGKSSGRYVRISLPSKQFLHLAEVQVLDEDGNNLALSGTATQSSTQFPGRAAQVAIDGVLPVDDDNNFTFTDNNENPWWEVDLGEIKEIAEIKVWNRADGAKKDRLNHAIVEVDPPNVTWVNHAEYHRTTAIGPRRGRIVKITLPGETSLALTEVEVLDANGNNLAYSKIARQSSTLVDASLANDNNIDGSTNYSMTDTEVLPFWEVDLGAVYDIAEIKIHNITDANNNGTDQLNGAVVEIDPPIQVKRIGNNSYDTFTAVGGRSGQVVRVSQPIKEYVTLAEVQVLDANGNNLALAGTARQSGLNSADLAIDDILPEDDSDNFSHTGNSKRSWWEVDLGSVKQIAEIIIWKRGDGRYPDQLNKAIVEIDPLEVKWEGHSVYDTTIAAGSSFGRVVRLSLPTNQYLALAEVQVLDEDGNNLALSGTATQSSTKYSGRVAGKAIDGILPADDTNNFTYTNNNAPPWWQVDLGSVQHIDKIIVWNRADGSHASRLNNAIVVIDP